MDMRRKRNVPWRYHVDHKTGSIYVVIHSAITAMGACKRMREMYPGYECSYCSDYYMDKLEG